MSKEQNKKFRPRSGLMTSAQQAFMWRKWHFGRLTSHWSGRNLNDLVIVVNALWTVGEFTKIWPNKIPCSPRCLLSIVLGHLNNCGLFKITHKNIPHLSLSDYLTCTKKFQSQYDFIFFNLSNQKPCWLPISFFLYRRVFLVVTMTLFWIFSH